MHNNYFNKQTILICCIVCYGFFTTNAAAQAITSVIPYELFGGKMIIEVYVNNKKERFFFDTGAERSFLTLAYCEANSLALMEDSIRVYDASNNTRHYRFTSVDTIATCDRKFKFIGIRPIVAEGDIFDCFDVAGLIGGDLLARSICTIDARTKTITITTAEKPSNESPRYSHGFLENKNIPVFELLVNGVSVKAMFDSGSSTFLKLKNSDYQALDSASAIRTLDAGSGDRVVTLSGLSVNTRTYRTQMENLRMGPAKFSNVVATTGNVPVTLLGAKVLDYGKIVIDYPRRRFYFIPYSSEPVTPDSKLLAFDLAVVGGKLTISTVWGGMSDTVLPGDIVTHINGKPTGTYNFCESITKGIEEFKEKGAKILTIQTKDDRTIELEYDR